ncbi:MAG TPA: penicillin-binding protein activator LpoB [Anaeromyxobacter sp.]
MNRLAWLAAAAALAALSACAPVQVRRMDTKEEKDLSGRWNDTDARLVAEEMIPDCLGRPWLATAQQRLGGRSPTVIVGLVRNQSLEHINTDSFVEALQRALINSGKVAFVASKEERAQLRDERKDQDQNASDATRKAHGEEQGADYVLSGAINAIQDEVQGEKVVFYQVNLKLLEVKSNQIAWNGQQQIRKNVVRSAFGL